MCPCHIISLVLTCLVCEQNEIWVCVYVCVYDERSLFQKTRKIGLFTLCLLFCVIIQCGKYCWKKILIFIKLFYYFMLTITHLFQPLYSACLYRNKVEMVFLGLDRNCYKENKQGLFKIMIKYSCTYEAMWMDVSCDNNKKKNSVDWLVSTSS